MLLIVHELHLTGTQEILFLLVAVMILGIGIFRFDSLFDGPKQSAPADPARKHRVHYIVEDEEEAEPASIEPLHKQ
jgi:hypothetical protein